MEPLVKESLVGRLEQARLLDPVAKLLQAGVRSVVPQESRLKDLLSGTWLGHPLHPPLTDLVIGGWTSALLLDLLGGEGAEDAADRLVAVGIVAAAPAALSGLSDWAELSGASRRVGSVHAIANSTALALQALSLLARRRGDRARGLTLSLAGVAVATAAAWLGGHLSFVKGVGVNQAAFQDPPTDWTAVARAEEVREGALTPASADGLEIVLVRRSAQISALLDRCSHRGCALHAGRLEDGAIVCPCHGSTFRLDGTIVKGPASSPQRALEVRVAEGTVEVRAGEA
jgi:nitrite reductase/ring-hydroxylating ferredoxin subunit/uncharacterized membrane protein